MTNSDILQIIVMVLGAICIFPLESYLKRRFSMNGMKAFVIGFFIIIGLAMLIAATARLTGLT